TARLEYRCGAVWVKPRNIDSFIFDISWAPFCAAALPTCTVVLHEAFEASGTRTAKRLETRRGPKPPIVMSPQFLPRSRSLPGVHAAGRRRSARVRPGRAGSVRMPRRLVPARLAEGDEGGGEVGPAVGGEHFAFEPFQQRRTIMQVQPV